MDVARLLKLHLDQNSLYYYAAIAALVLVAFYLNDLLSKPHPTTRTPINYGYDHCNGPAVWGNFFAEAKGEKQSPINITTADTMCVPSEGHPLKFSDEFSTVPSDMKVFNSGLNVILYATWPGGKRACVSGGPLERSVYKLLNVRFRWGVSNDEGTEHMVDTKRFAMEMQVAMARNSDQTKADLVEAARNRSLLMISYFFMATPTDNPYLEPLVQTLKHVQCPKSCVTVCPFPLKLLMPAFSGNYFTYEGSLTFPPCTEGVRWIVQPEPLLISARQVGKFRKLGGCNFSRIATNTRPVQLLNDREVFFYD